MVRAVNTQTDRVIIVEDSHFNQVLSKQGWVELKLPTSVQEYIDAGGFVPVPEVKPKAKRKTPRSIVSKLRKGKV
jgi:hypothetical protein